MESNEERIVVVYIGRIEHNNKSIAHRYIIEGVHENMIFKKKISIHHIGTRIECTKIPTGVKGPYTAIGHSDSEDMRKWRNRDQAVYDEYCITRESAKKLVSKHDAIISELRRSYKELPAIQRMTFINRLILDITK